jgi:hypothetical protein
MGAAGTATAADGMTVSVPAGTLVPVQTLAGYDSFSSREGTPVRYRVTGDVVIDGEIVARAGDRALGHVEQSRSGLGPGPGPGAFDHGLLRVSVDSVRTFCGSTLRVASEQHADVPDADGDVGFPRGTMFVSTVAGTQTVCASAQ